MEYPSQRALLIRGCILLVAVHFLSGCTLAPGMHFDDSQVRVEPPSGTSAAKPILKTITPQVILQEQELAKNGVHADLAEIMTPPQPYRIGSGDHLAITVWDHPELVMPVSTVTGTLATLSGTTAASYTVSPEGRIQFPYAGDFKVEGLTELEARDLLAERLSHFIKKPEVTLKVLNFRSKRVYVDGEVKNPGIVMIDDIPMSLPEAINRAGGVTALGDQSRILITRNKKTYRVDMTRLKRDGIDPSRIMLASGDLLRISPSDESKVFVVGEVTKPVALPMRNGRMTLNEALGEAGGINPATADANQIYVVRNANDAQPTIYHLDGESPVMLALAEGFELRPKDVVYVDAASMVRFNRIVSLILPTAQTITIVNRGFQ